MRDFQGSSENSPYLLTMQTLEGDFHGLSDTDRDRRQSATKYRQAAAAAT
jgi:hypothetical protein